MSCLAGVLTKWSSIHGSWPWKWKLNTWLRECDKINTETINLRKLCILRYSKVPLMWFVMLNGSVPHFPLEPSRLHTEILKLIWLQILCCLRCIGAEITTFVGRIGLDNPHQIAGSQVLEENPASHNSLQQLHLAIGAPLDGAHYSLVVCQAQIQSFSIITLSPQNNPKHGW